MNDAVLPFLPSLFALPSSSLSPAVPALLVFYTLFSKSLPCLKLSSLDLPESSETTLDWQGFAASGSVRVASSP